MLLHNKVLTVSLIFLLLLFSAGFALNNLKGRSNRKVTGILIFDAICIVIVAVYASLLFHLDGAVKNSIEKQPFK